MKLRIALPLKLLTEKVDAFIDQELFHRRLPAERGEADVLVYRNGPVSIEKEGEHLLLAIPVHVKVHLIRTGVELLEIFKDLTPLDDIKFNITLLAAVKFALKEDLNIESQTTTRFIWDRKPSMGFGPLRVNIPTMVTPFIREELVRAGEEIDRFLREEIDLRQYADMGWEWLGQVIPLPENGMSLRFFPFGARLGIGPLRFLPDTLEIDLDVPVQPEVVVGPAPPVSLPSHLPDPQNLAEELLSTFEARVQIAFSELAGWLEREPIETDWGPVKLSELSFWGENQHIRVGGKVSMRVPVLGRKLPAELKAMLFLHASPAQEVGEFQLQNLTLSFQNGPWWLKVLYPFSRRSILAAIRSSIEEEVNRRSREAIQYTREALAELDLEGGLKLMGEVGLAGPAEWESHAEGISVRLPVAGDLALRIGQLGES